MVTVRYRGKIYTPGGALFTGEVKKDGFVVAIDGAIDPFKNELHIRDGLKQVNTTAELYFFRADEGTIAVHVSDEIYAARLITEEEREGLKNLLGEPQEITPDMLNAMVRHRLAKEKSIARIQERINVSRIFTYCIITLFCSLALYVSGQFLSVMGDGKIEQAAHRSKEFRERLDSQVKKKAGGIIERLNPKVSVKVARIMNNTAFYKVKEYSYGNKNTVVTVEPEDSSSPVGENLKKFGKVIQDGKETKILAQ